MLMFFYIDGIIHCEFVAHGQTINQHFYKGVLQHLQNAVKLKRPGKMCTSDCLLGHDNGPTYTTLSMQQYLVKNNMAEVCHLQTLQIWLPVISGSF
jgi:hypothetical protein